MRTETWVQHADDEPFRVVQSFTYPHPLDVAPTLFDPGAIDVERVVRLDQIDEARTQCMINLRSLVVFVTMYAAEHDGRLPAALADLEPYVDAPLDWYVVCSVPGERAPVAVHSYLDGHQVKLDELDPTDVLFECQFGDKFLAAFADGHVEMLDQRRGPG